MFGLWKYSEEWDTDTWYPFKSGWSEMQLLLIILQASLGLMTGILISTVVMAQPFLAVFIFLMSLYLFLYLRKLEKRMNQITETT